MKMNWFDLFILLMLNEHYHEYVIHTSHQDGWQQKNRNQEFACIILSKLSFILKIFFLKGKGL